MHALKRAILAAAALSLAAPASAQLGGYEAEQFVAAIRKGDGSEALKLLNANPSLVNARDLNGKTGLITAIEQRDTDWAGYLLQQGADPNLALRSGETPLIAASRIGLVQVAEWLVGVGARVNDSNRMGETPLIIAVQQRQVPIVRLLIKSGADPDHTDSAAGYSARDYAKRDTRNPEILKIIEAAKAGN